MLDLGKPYGQHEGLIFYGDHADDRVVYYFPDEVGFGTREDGKAELYFQLFQESKIYDGGIDALRETAGSILEVGAICTVSEDRLNKALGKIKAAYNLPEDISATPPLWIDGSVDLITLDASTRGDESSLVKRIIGSGKPSLATTDLKSIFNVRFDHVGTELIYSTLHGNKGSVAGVMYDLKYAALRPAIDLRVSANLSRCQETARHSLDIGLDLAYDGFKLEAGADLDWLTKKMEENGDIQVEVLSMVEDDSQRQLIDSLVKEFKNTVLNELFEVRDLSTGLTDEKSTALSDAVSGLTEGLTEGIAQMSESPVKLSIGYSFKEEKISQNRVLEADYRESSTVVRTHNPQSHLWMMSKHLRGEIDDYISKVNLGNLWKNQELNMRMLYDFEATDADLTSAEIIVWRRKDGVAGTTDAGGFLKPASATPVDNFIFDKTTPLQRKVSWLSDDEEDVGYYYQIRFVYDGAVKNLSSPRQVVTPPVISWSSDLYIQPDACIWYKNIPVTATGLDFEDLTGVDLSLSIEYPKAGTKDIQQIHLDSSHLQDRLIVRSESWEVPAISLAKTFHYKDGRAPVIMNPVYLSDDEIALCNPTIEKDWLMVLSGKAQGIESVIVHFSVRSSLYGSVLGKTFVLNTTEEPIKTIRLPFYNGEDVIEYQVQIVDAEHKVKDLEGGSFNASDNSTIVIDISKADNREIKFEWQGASPADAGLKYLNLTLKDGSGEVIDTIRYSGSKAPVTKTFTLPADASYFMDIERKWEDGEKETEKGIEITSDTITLKA